MKRLPAAIFLYALGLVLAPALAAQTTVIDHPTMNQWVRSAGDGSLQGRVVLTTEGGQENAVAGAHVAILNADGDVRLAKSDAKGDFKFTNIQTGQYALSVRGDNVFACCAMHVVGNDSALEAVYPDAIEVSVANIDYTTVHLAVLRYMPPNIPIPSPSLTEPDLVSLADRVCGRDLFRVARIDGGIRGRLHHAGSELHLANATNVFLFRGGVEVARALTDENGEFIIDDVDAGHHALLAVGSGGIGLIGFEIVDQTKPAAIGRTADESRERLVMLQDVPDGSAPEMFAMQITPMSQVVDAASENYVRCMTIDGPVTITRADGSQSTEQGPVSFILGAGQETIADEQGQVLYENVQIVDGCPGQCTTIDGPVTIVGPDGSRVTQEGPVSFITGQGDQSIEDQDGQVMYQNVQVVAECPGEIIDDGGIIIPDGEIVMDGFGSPLPGGGFASGPGSGPGSGYGGGGGGGGGGGFGGGAGSIAAIAGIGAAVAASDGNDTFAPPVIASPAVPIVVGN